MTPLLINMPESMLRVRILTLKDHAERAVKQIQDLGVLHVEEAKELNPVDLTALEKQKSRTQKTLGFISEILAQLPGERTVQISGPAPATLDEIIDKTSGIYEEVSELLRKHEAVAGDIALLRETEKHLGILAGKLNIPVKDLRYSGSYIFTDVVVLTEETHRLFLERAGDALISETSASQEGAVVSYIIARTTGRRDLQSAIRELSAIQLAIPDEDVPLREYLEENRGRLIARRHTLAAIEKETAELVGNNLKDIVLFREILEREYERISVLTYANESRYLTLIEGWVPEGGADTIIRGIRTEISHAFVETRKPSGDDEPPTKLKNPRGIKPFELLIHLFGLPKYGEWDPTPSVAYSFAFFFGLMLNDTGYGLGLILVARFVLDKLVDDPTSEGTGLFRKLLYTSGTVATVIGILSGSHFGDFFTAFLGVKPESLALSSWVQAQLADPISFIILAIIIGLIHLNVAHALGMAKGIKERKFGIVVLKTGLFVMQIFGIPYLMKSMLSLDLLPLDAATYQLFFYITMASVVLVIIGAFMENGGLGAIFWIFEITGVLGDVMSYCRLAGVGLATYYLAASFNLIAGWIAKALVASVPGVIGITLGFIVGTVLCTVFHTFNVFLGSLGAFIHSLRLCFVEFLLKFYDGGGREYAPFHFRIRKEVTVGKKI